MYDRAVGVSILTNGGRSEYLDRCVKSVLENCFTRPLVIGIFDNGSHDDTPFICRKFCEFNYYGIKWRVKRSDMDLGCARGTNESIKLVEDMEYVLHLESDFRHLSESESGIDKLWMKQAVELLETGLADYIYLRRMRSNQEMAMHWFQKWKEKIIEVRGPFQYCENFWWSNNPSLFRVKAMYDCYTLPLNEKLDGPKNSSNWSRPELEAPRPTKAWLWGFGEGMFVHDG